MSKFVFAVHAIRPDEICCTEIVFTSPTRADEYALAVSTDPGVLAGAVTRYTRTRPVNGTPSLCS